MRSGSFLRREVFFVLFFGFALACASFSCAEEILEEPEALKYFSSEQPRYHLAARLYRAGAIYVGVIEISGQAGGLKVYLPSGKEQRSVIFSISNEVLSQYGFRTEDDEGQDILTVWFKA